MLFDIPFSRTAFQKGFSAFSISFYKISLIIYKLQRAAVFGRFYLAPIMLCHPAFNIIGITGIKLVVLLAMKDINVKHNLVIHKGFYDAILYLIPVEIKDYPVE